MIIQGQVTDKEDNSALPQANVWLSDSKGTKLKKLIGVASDNNGFYTIDTSLNTKATHITASYIGFGKTIAPITNVSTINLPLDESNTLLETFEIVHYKDKNNVTKKKKYKTAIIVVGVSLLTLITAIIVYVKVKKLKN